MGKLSHDEIVRRLERHGLRHRSVSMEIEGEYLPSDVDWNNKDIPHRNHVHSLISDVACVIEEDLQAVVSLQRICGVRVPVVFVHYDTEPNRQTHVMTQLAWTMVTSHEFFPLTPTRTRAITTYTVAGNRFWMVFWPLIRWLLRVNYRKLMAEDRPLRERRGELRSWGYGFVGDDGPHDIRRTLHVNVDYVIAPQAEVPPEPTVISLASVRADRWTDVGRSDHLGLRLRREGEQVVAYPRICMHEGADLSSVDPDDGALICPWHGRQCLPIARLRLDGGAAVASTPWHDLALNGAEVTIEVRGAKTDATDDVTQREVRP